jgi:hypothetical protein
VRYNSRRSPPACSLQAAGLVRKAQRILCRKQGCVQSPMNTHIVDTPRIHKLKQCRISERVIIYQRICAAMRLLRAAIFTPLCTLAS